MFDSANIPSETIREVMRGVQTAMPALADEICTPLDRLVLMSGTIPGLSEPTTLATDRATGYEPGESVAGHEGGMANTTYNCKRFHDFYQLTTEEMINLDALDLGSIETFLQLARAGANNQLDLLLNSRLTSTSLNTEFNVTTSGTGEWDDYTTSKPFKDMQNAINNSGLRGGIGVFGLEIVSVLQSHPDFNAESSNFNAGMLSQDDFARSLAGKLGLSRVFLLEKHYNGAAAGITPSITLLGARTAWIGRQANLIKVHPRHREQDKSWTEELSNPPGTNFHYARYDDIVRPFQSQGVVFTNLFQ